MGVMQLGTLVLVQEVALVVMVGALTAAGCHPVVLAGGQDAATRGPGHLVCGAPLHLVGTQDSSSSSEADHAAAAGHVAAADHRAFHARVHAHPGAIYPRGATVLGAHLARLA